MPPRIVSGEVVTLPDRNIHPVNEDPNDAAELSMDARKRAVSEAVVLSPAEAALAGLGSYLKEADKYREALAGVDLEAAIFHAGRANIVSNQRLSDAERRKQLSEEALLAQRQKDDAEVAEQTARDTRSEAQAKYDELHGRRQHLFSGVASALNELAGSTENNPSDSNDVYKQAVLIAKSFQSVLEQGPEGETSQLEQLQASVLEAKTWLEHKITEHEVSQTDLANAKADLAQAIGMIEDFKAELAKDTKANQVRLRHAGTARKHAQIEPDPLVRWSQKAVIGPVIRVLFAGQFQDDNPTTLKIVEGGAYESDEPSN